MKKDPRTKKERERGYPPSPARVISRCTKLLCGLPNEELFDRVVELLLKYLRNPELTVDEIIKDVSSIPGSKAAPGVHLKSMKQWPKSDFAPLGGKALDRKTARKLVRSKPKTWAAVMRLKGMGVEIFYTLFRMILVHEIRSKGEGLVCFLWADGSPIDGTYFQVRSSSFDKAPNYVKVRTGIPYDVSTDELFVFPELGKYIIRTAFPQTDFVDEQETYQEENLRVQPTQPISEPFAGSTFTVRIDQDSRIQRATYVTNGLRVFCNPRFTKLVLVKQVVGYQSGYPAPLHDSHGRIIQTKQSSNIVFKKQEELEFSGLGVKRPSGEMMVVFSDIRPGIYKVLGYSDDETVVATVSNLYIDNNEFEETTLVHTFEINRVDEEPPKRAQLQGDIIRQQDVKNQSSGAFALAHVLNYWVPLSFNPRQLNGEWVMKKYGKELAGHAGNPKLKSGTIEYVAKSFGLSHQSYTAIADRELSLEMLKRWIYAGIPVIVCADEYMGRKEGGNQYKVLMGYDDSVQMHYHRSTGPRGLHAGALYFLNSGTRGLHEGESRNIQSTAIPPMYRETHPDYDRVPIGNDADAYIVFWEKWRVCNKPSGSKLWFFPVYPVKWDLLAKFGKRVSGKMKKH